MAESWLPTTVWFDNLDVLGGEAYQSPGLHTDPNLLPSWKTKLEELVSSGRDLSVVLYYAGIFEASGYPVSAQALRDRALAITIWLDAGISGEDRHRVEELLQFETSTEVLIDAARKYEGKGLGSAGNALRERAALLRIARRRAMPAPEIVWPWARTEGSLAQ